MRRLIIVPLALVALAAGAATRAVQDQCGPFTDVSPLFCPYVLEAYYTGITAGTSATTFSPDRPITRGEAAVFTTKGLDQALSRGSRRAALGQWWTPTGSTAFAVTALPGIPFGLASDGADIWVANLGFMSRVRASDGRLLENWTVSSGCVGAVLIAMGRVFGTDCGPTPQLLMLDPSQPAGAMTAVATMTGTSIGALAFDGSRFWTWTIAGPVSQLAIITPSATPPWSVTYVTVPNATGNGILFDGNSVWITANSYNSTPGALLRLDPSGAVVQAVYLGQNPLQPVFDGTNIWVPDIVSNTLSVVRANTGAVLATLSGNGMNPPVSVAFDGQRILVTGPCASLWNATNLSPLGCVPLPVGPSSLPACSDGVNFWIGSDQSELLRF